MVDFRQHSHCALSYNGIILDRYLDNYMTLNVEGRQLFSPTLETLKVPGRDGDIAIGKNYPSRDIKVHFLMEAEKNEEWLKQIKVLNTLLQSEGDVEFFFDDELGYRYGQLSDIEDPPFDSNLGIGKFTIHCQDPFLYSDVKTSTGTMPDLEYDFYDVKIVSIESTINYNCKKVVIKNKTRGLKIVLNGDFKSGDKLVVTPDSIKVNKQNKMMWLDYVESDYHDFKVFSKDQISVGVVVGNTTYLPNMIIKYRERVL